MTSLPQSIGTEEILASPYDSGAPLESLRVSNFRRPQRRYDLSKMIEKNMERLLGRSPRAPWANAKEEGYLWFVVMWDHWQPDLDFLIATGEI